MLRLNIIGCGRLGKTLASLFVSNETFKIGSVLTQSQASADQAIAVIGDGMAINHWEDFEVADVWLIATPDGHIAEIPQHLLSHKLIRSDDVVFHCSGALPASVLSSLNDQGAHIGSVHPVKSFADVQQSIESFSGTWCGVEGDDRALSILQPAFKSIGGHCFQIESKNKTHYHIANVMVCNYLTALIEVGMREFVQAGVSRDQAMLITEPILRGTLDNIQKMGTAKALTGPVARSDYEVVEKQLAVLQKGDARIAQIYKLLGSVAADLATEQVTGQAIEENQNLEHIKQLFNQY